MGKIAKVFLILVIISFSLTVIPPIINEINRNNVCNKYTFFSQKEIFYCGEACIQMMLKVYNFDESNQTQLAIEANYNPGINGTPISGMMQPFLKRGLDASDYNSNNFTEAYSQLTNVLEINPVIILVTMEDDEENYYGHYLFVFGFDGNEMIYHDPQSGKCQYFSKDTLKVIWFDNCNFTDRATCWFLWIQD